MQDHNFLIFNLTINKDNSITVKNDNQLVGKNEILRKYESRIRTILYAQTKIHDSWETHKENLNENKIQNITKEQSLFDLYKNNNIIQATIAIRTCHCHVLVDHFHITLNEKLI